METYTISQRIRTFSFASALIKTALGFWFIIPFWDTLGTIAGYREMNKYFAPHSDIIWGCIYFFVGIVHMYSVFTDKFLFRLILSYLSTGLLGFLALQTAFANQITTGIPLFGSLTIMEIIVLVFRMIEHKNKRFV